MVVGPRKREGSRRAEAASAGLWRAENAAAGKDPLTRRKNPQCAHTQAALGPPSWGCGVTPHVHYMHDRWSVGVPPLAPPLPTLVAVAYRSLPRLAPPGGWRFRFLPLFVTYLELNRHCISRKRENADHKKGPFLFARLADKRG